MSMEFPTLWILIWHVTVSTGNIDKSFDVAAKTSKRKYNIFFTLVEPDIHSVCEYPRKHDWVYGPGLVYRL